MSELDKLKENINQMRLWLGILAVTDISLISWVVSHRNDESLLLLIAAGCVVIGLSGTVVWLNRKIAAMIERLGDLQHGYFCRGCLPRIYRRTALLRVRYNSAR